jgi:hypothetical protein
MMFSEENIVEKHFFVFDMSPNITVPCSTSNQSAVYVKNEVSGLEINPYSTNVENRVSS